MLSAVLLSMLSFIALQDPKAFVVPIGGGDYPIEVSLNAAPEKPEDLRARVRDADVNISATIGNVSVADLKASVTIRVGPGVSSLGVYTVELYDAKAVRGTRQIRLRWPRLSVPTFKIWKTANGPADASTGQVTIPTGTNTEHYTLELVRGDSQDRFLITDRVSFGSSHIRLADNIPNGPSTGNPTDAARFTFTIDPSNPPIPGYVSVDVSNADREYGTQGQILIVSAAEPRIASFSPLDVKPGEVKVTLTGSGFDPGSWVSVLGATSNEWVPERESRSVLKVTGMVQASAGKLELRVHNPNGKMSGRITIPVRSDIGALSIPEMASNTRVIYPAEEVDLTLELQTSPTNPAPDPARLDKYVVMLGDAEFQPTSASADGKLKVKVGLATQPEAGEAATSVTRSIRVVERRDDGVNITRWQKEEAIRFDLRPIVSDTARMTGGALLPGTERQVEIFGRHFKSEGTDIALVGKGVQVKQGSLSVKSGSVKFAIVASDDAQGPITVQLRQDKRSVHAGTLNITQLPGFQNIALRVNDKTAAITEGKTLSAGGPQEVYLIFDGTKLPSEVGPLTYVYKAVRDTVGEQVVVAERELIVSSTETKAERLFAVTGQGLEPGQRVRVQVALKNHANRNQAATIAIVRHRWYDYLGLRAGLTAVRKELGGSSRDGTLADAHFGLETFLSRNSNDLALGFGPTILGVKGATAGTPLGVALSGTIRFKTLSLMVGRQISENPVVPKPADESEESEEGNATVAAIEPVKGKARPWYFMIGASFGTDLASIASLIQ